MSQSAKVKPSGARFRMPGHSSTEEQMLALELMKNRMSTESKKVKNFSTNAKSQVANSKMTAQRHHWIRERNLQLNERRQAQREVTNSFETIVNGTKALATSGNENHQFDFAVRTVNTEAKCADACRNELAQTMMNSVISAVQRRHQKMNEKDAPVYKENISELRRIISQEVKNTQREFEKLNEEFNNAKNEIDPDLSRLVASVTPVPSNVHTAKASSADEADCVIPSPVKGFRKPADSYSHLQDLVNGEIENIQLTLFPTCSPELQQMFSDLLHEKLNTAISELQEVQQSLDDLAPSLEIGNVDNVNLQEKVLALLREYSSNRHATYSVPQSRQLLYDRLGLEYPSIPQFSIMQIVNAVQRKKQMEGKQLNIERAHEGELMQLLENYRSVAEADVAWQGAEKERLEELELKAKEREKLKFKLAELQEKKKETEAKSLQEQLEAQDAQNKIEEAKRQQLQREMDLRLQQLEAFRIHQMEQKRIEMEELRKKQEVDAVENQQRMEYNQQRVGVRKQDYDAKVQYRQAQSAKRKQDQEEQQAKVAMFLQKVESQVGVERDPERVHQPTISTTSGIESHYRTLGEQQMIAGQGKMHGYSSEAIVKDPRFRIQSAIVASGLQHTQYAQQYLKQFVAPSLGRNATSNDNTMGFF